MFNLGFLHSNVIFFFLKRQIPFADQFQMTSEIRSLPEVCDALRAAEITISLLASTGADPNCFYKKYLEDIRMDPCKYLVSVKVWCIVYL